MLRRLAMNEIFEMILNSEEICNFDFPVYYHKRGEMINNNIVKLPSMFPFSSHTFNATREHVKCIKRNLIDLLTDNRGYIVLWYLNAVRKEDKSLLDMISPLFEGINHVTRGGINTYKQSGWMVHVLYVFQLVSFNIRNDVIPTSFLGESSELKEAFHIMNRLYWEMEEESRFILNVLALIHDIGVVDGVQNHDKDGEKYVTGILKDLSITSSILQTKNIELGFDSFCELLRIFVSNHTLINKISAEESDLCIHDKCEAILERLSIYNDLSNKIFSDMASIFLIIGMADLIAVDDKLFTLPKFTLAYDSYNFLQKMFLGFPCNRDRENVAMMRLHQMLPEDTYNDLKLDSLNILDQLSVQSEQFWNGLYEIYEFEYATAFLKLLKSLRKVLFVLSKILDFISKKQDYSLFDKSVVKFDSDMNTNTFAEAVNCGEFKNGITVLYNQSRYNGKLLNMKYSVLNSTLVLEISDTPIL